MKTNSVFSVLPLALLAVFLSNVLPLNAQEHPMLGSTDIKAYLQSVPGLPKSTEEAMQRAGRHPLQPDHQAINLHYRPFEERVEHRIGDYHAFAKQKLEQGQATPANMTQEAETMANSSPIIAGMGGYDKVVRMSEAEAKVAAQQAAAQYAANPFAASGGQSPGMTALYQKIMADPAYAKKFERMSEAEKEAELRKYMANDAPVAMTPEQVKTQQVQAAKQRSEADLVRNSQEIQMKVSEWLQRLALLQQGFAEKTSAIGQAGRSHDAIATEIGQRYGAIPIVELGEYGRDRDPEQVRLLRIEEARLHRERAAEELKKKAAAWAEYSLAYQSFLPEYLGFLRDNSHKIYGGTSAADMIRGINTEQPLLAFEASLLNTALELSKQSRAITEEAAQWEASFVEKVR